MSLKTALAAVGAFLAKAGKAIENEGEKIVHDGFSFLKNTAAALAKDPVMLSAIQAGKDAALAAVLSAVETNGTSALPAAALAAAKSLVISAGGTAEHELIPIVAGELHATVAASSAGTPEHANQ